MLRSAVMWFVTIALLGAGACGSGSLGSLDAATGDDAVTGTFPCGDFQCMKGKQYCFFEQNNGLDTIPRQCRSMPPGCSVCACAKPDATSASMNPVCSGAELVCTDGMLVIDENASTPTLNISCGSA